MVMLGTITFRMITHSAPKDPAAKTTLLDVQNNKVELSQFKGKVLIACYFQTWCRPCREEQIELMQLQQHYGDQLKIVMITDESFDKVVQMNSVIHSDLTYYRSEKPLKKIGIRRYPITYLLNKKDEKVFAKVEETDWYNDETIKTIDKLLQ